MVHCLMNLVANVRILKQNLTRQHERLLLHPLRCAQNVKRHLSGYVYIYAIYALRINFVHQYYMENFSGI